MHSRMTSRAPKIKNRKYGSPAMARSATSDGKESSSSMDAASRQYSTGSGSAWIMSLQVFAYHRSRWKQTR